MSPGALNAVLVALSVLTVLVGAWMRTSFYLLTTLLVIYALVFAFAGFERGRASVRLMALVAACSALAVVSRVMFAPVPFFKPTVGVVMLAGIALGARNGFLVGAIALLASNLLFGEGPWTPWQMLAFGLDGLVFGLLADKGLVVRARWSTKTRTAVSLLGAAFVLLVAGPILDTSSVLIFSTGAFTLEGTLAVYAAGFVPNAILAAATFLTVYLLGNPFLAMMERVRSKYGIGS